MQRRVYLVTWNLRLNREHSLYQTTYEDGIFPEKLILSGNCTAKEKDFNFFLDKNALVNMESNLPVQFFDFQDDSNILPRGLFTNHVDGMRRIASDRSRYLDIV